MTRLADYFSVVGYDHNRGRKYLIVALRVISNIVGGSLPTQPCYGGN